MDNTNYGKVTIDNRKRIELTLVDDVLSFDDTSIMLQVASVSMIIDGEDLKIEEFSGQTGSLTLTGKIDSVAYLDDDNSKSTKSGLFRR